VVRTAKEAVVSKKLPKSDLPFSYGFKGGNLVFTSGQWGIDPKTNQAVEGVEAQTRQALENLEVVLEAAGCTRRDVVKVTVFLASMRDFKAMNKAYVSFFEKPYPARTTVEAKLANESVRVEIEAIAVK